MISSAKLTIKSRTQTELATTLVTPVKSRLTGNADQQKCDVSDRTWNAAKAIKRGKHSTSADGAHNNQLFWTCSRFFISNGLTGHVWRSCRSIQSDPFSAYITSSSPRCFPYILSTLACMVIISAPCLHNIVYLSSPQATSSTNRGPVSAAEQGLQQTLSGTPRSAVRKN